MLTSFIESNRKDPNDKHHLVINEETAPTVRQIFKWRSEGISVVQIGRKLNDAGVLSPSAYLYETGEVKTEKYKGVLWQTQIVKSILSHPVYIYDLYSRELSAKVKSAKRMRAEKGLFLSPFAPYGYVKDPDDKNRLLIDEEAAKIVRMVFTMTADGMKPVEIASMLNHEDVPTPMLHKRAAGCSRDRWPSVHEENFWTTAMICKILRDERYLGKCVYGKRERDMVGNVHTLKHKNEIMYMQPHLVTKQSR